MALTSDLTRKAVWVFYDNTKELEHIAELEEQLADAQRALDAEREKVKELVANQAEYEKCTDEQITALNQGCLDYEKQIATLQAQLAEIEQILCIESGKTTVDKVRDLHHSFKQVWNSYQSAVNELFDTQAQLRQVEGERQALRQLVAALPVVDGRMDVECGACYYIRSFVAGQYGIVCGLITEQSTAMAIKALLEYRATLAAKDAGTAVSSG